MIVLLALAVRLIKPDFLDLNDDEAFFVQIAHLGTYLQAMKVSEPHPPLYLAMLQGWMLAAGPTEFAIRYLTIAQGVLLVAALYRVGRQLGGNPLGLATAFVAALNPYQILYSQTARDYELACLFGALSFFVLLKALPRPRLIPLYVALALLALYSHYYAMGVVAFEQVLLLIALIRQAGASPRRWRDWLVAEGVMALLYLPWLGYVAHTIATYNPGHGTPRIVWDSFVQAFQFYNFGETFDPTRILLPSLAVGLMVLLGLAGLWRHGGSRALWLSAGYQLSVILFGFITFVHTNQFGARFIFIGSPGYYLVLGGAMVLLWRTWRFWAILPVAVIAYLGATAIHNRVLTHRYVTNGYRELGAYLAAHVSARDTVLLDGVSQWFQYWYYAEFRNGVTQRVEFMPRDASGNGADGTAVSVSQTAAMLKQLASSSSGLWFINSDALRYDPHLDTERLLAANWFPAYQHNFVFQTVTYFGVAADGPLQARSSAIDGWQAVQASVASAPAAAGRPLDATVVWRASRANPPLFKDSLRLVNSAGAIAGQQDGQLQDGFFSPSGMRAGSTFVDHRGLIVPVGTPPGVYHLQLVAYNPATGAALGAPLALGPVTIDHAQPQPPVTDGLVPLHLAIDGRTLLGTRLPSAPSTAGGRVPITLLWSGGRVAPNATVDVGIGPDHVRHVIGGAYPTSQWQPEDVVRDTFELRTPVDLPPGKQPVTIAGEIIGQVTIAPGHYTFTPPAIPHQLGSRFGDIAQLLGWGAQPGRVTLRVTLYWKVLGETDTSYAVFVHLVDAAGAIRAQADVPPGTDNWVTGEIVTTSYDLSTNQGLAQAHLEVGLYDAASGKRLPVCTRPGCARPGDHVVIPLSGA